MHTPNFLRAVLVLLVAICWSSPAFAQLPNQIWKISETDSQKWIKRISRLCPPDGWTVTAQANDIVVQRVKPVSFRQHAFNANPSDKDRPRGIALEGLYRLTLQFSPLLSQDEYEKLSAENEASEKADFQLRRKYRVGGKFNIITSRTAEEKKREQEYRQEAKKLIFHRLPTFYTPDYSITLYQSWRWFEFLDSGDEAIDTECNEVRDSMVKLFGVYSVLVAANSSEFGYPETLRGEPR